VLLLACQVQAQAQTATEKVLEDRIARLEESLKKAIDKIDQLQNNSTMNGSNSAISAATPQIMLGGRGPAVTAPAISLNAAEPSSNANTTTAPLFGVQQVGNPYQAAQNPATEEGLRIYGAVNVAIVHNESANTTTGTNSGGTTQMVNPNGGSTKLGFLGLHNIKQGAVDSVYGQIELQYDTPNGTNNAGLAMRESWVGLKTQYGDIGFGRGKSVMTKAQEYASGTPMYTLSSKYSFDFGGDSNPFLYAGGSSSSQSMGRWANDIRYLYNYGPLAFRADYALDNGVANGGAKYGASLRWTYRPTGVITMAAAHEDNLDYSTDTTKYQNYTVCITAACTGAGTALIQAFPGSSGVTPNTDANAYVIGIRDKFFGVTASLAYNYVTYINPGKNIGATNGMDHNSISSLIASLTYPITLNHSIGTAVLQNNSKFYNGVEQPTTASKRFGVMYNYAFDSKTNIRVEYSRGTADSGSEGYTFGGGLLYEF